MVDRHTYRPIAPIATSRRGRAMRQFAAIAATFALTLVAFTSAAAAHSRGHSAGCGYAHTPIHSATRGELRSAVVCLVNQERARRHLPGLVANRRLNRSAQGWTNMMVTHRLFTHGADFASRISAVGFDWSNAGENIAAGFQTPASVVHAWMRSTGHCQNILSPIFRMVGTGVSGGAPETHDNGTWTQDFGLWMGQHPASANYAPAQGCPYNS
jgi:uncharacterized protein YkwD